jgi:ubiquinone/menaquinone biosynthesis C-methylase UbiE
MYPTGPQKEHPSTYFVQDQGSVDEMTRLSIQDKMLTEGQGGVLPELADPSLLRRVLDVGCGTGGWLMEVALTYPTIEKLVGADVSSKMLTYARAQAENQQLGQRVQFQTMDALRVLEFPPASFDLVNQRFGMSWLRTWEWTKILLEYRRVCRPGGIIRVTEPNVVAAYENSPALTKLNAIALTTTYRSGCLFAETSDGITSELPTLFIRHGIADVQTHLHALVYHSGTVEAQRFSEDMAIFYRVGLPYFQKWTRVPKDYEDLYQQALLEMKSPDFAVKSTILTVWGTPDGKKLLMRGLR